MSASKQWEMGDGEVSEIHTPWTNRARDLQVIWVVVLNSKYVETLIAPNICKLKSS